MFVTNHCSGPLAALLLYISAPLPLPAEAPPTGTRQSPPSVAQKTDPAQSPSPTYRLSVNDTVVIRVFQEQELDTTARIGRDGAIAFPLIGSVIIGGRTVPEAANAITQALKEYLVQPQVSLRITDYTKRKFTVLGQVNRPGTFELPDENSLTLLEGIGLAGGYSRIANPSKVVVKRRNAGGEQVFHLDAKQMAKGNTSSAFLLQQGDTVIVEESLF